ncbi:hypothetical protein LPUS_09560, partial [Lasallia pustulata]
MSEMWGIESVAGRDGWWLDNEEGLSDMPILREIRRMGEERGKGGEKGDFKQALRDMRAIFSKLNVK